MGFVVPEENEFSGSSKHNMSYKKLIPNIITPIVFELQTNKSCHPVVLLTSLIGGPSMGYTLAAVEIPKYISRCGCYNHLFRTNQP